MSLFPRIDVEARIPAPVSSQTRVSPVQRLVMNTPPFVAAVSYRPSHTSAAVRIAYFADGAATL
jgi:hypothetical protein